METVVTTVLRGYPITADLTPLIDLLGPKGSVDLCTGILLYGKLKI